MQNCLISPKVQVWHACNFPTVHLQQQHKAMSDGNIHRVREDQSLHMELGEEDGSRYTAHANIIYNKRVFKCPRYHKGCLHACTRWMCTKAAAALQSKEVGKLSGAKHMAGLGTRHMYPSHGTVHIPITERLPLKPSEVMITRRSF